MLKKTITYTDYDGNERTEDHYFNLSESELAEMNLSTEGGYDKMIQRISQAQDNAALLKAFKDIIRISYGVKSLDGKRFVKGPEVFEEFSQTGAYDRLFMELLSDDKAAFSFVKGILPDKLRQEADEAMSKQGLSVV